jgi:hypothetical protein
MSAAGPFLRPSQPRRRRRRSLSGRVARGLVRLVPMLALPLAAWYWINDGDTFALSAVETAGSPRISPDWIERALEPEIGSNLLALPLDRVRRRLEANPWLGRIEARKELPHVLRVDVEERMAAAVLETEDGLWYVDADGERIARLEPGESPGGLLRVAAGATSVGISPALASAEAASVRHALAIETEVDRASLPDWSQPVLWVEVIGDDDYRVYLGTLPFPVLVRSQDVARRVATLEELRPAILERAPIVAEVDLRFERRVIVRPALDQIAAWIATVKAARHARSGRVSTPLDAASDSGEPATGEPGAGDPDVEGAGASARPPVERIRSAWDPQPKET